MVECYICKRTEHDLKNYIEDNFTGLESTTISELKDILAERMECSKRIRNGHEDAISDFLNSYLTTQQKCPVSWPYQEMRLIHELYHLNKMKYPIIIGQVNPVIKANNSTLDLLPYLKKYWNSLGLAPINLLNFTAQSPTNELVAIVSTDPAFYNFVMTSLDENSKQLDVRFQIGQFRTYKATFGIDDSEIRERGIPLSGKRYFVEVNLCPICSSLFECASSASYNSIQRQNDWDDD